MTQQPATQTVPILLYHSVSSDASPAFHKWAVPAEKFADQMMHLDHQGYTVLTASELTDARRSGVVPPRPVVITFDDGFADFHSAVLPILERHAFKATLYITTGYVGGSSGWLHAKGEGDRRMLTWEQVDELDAYGIECGAHTHSHPMLDLLSRKAAEDEIARSKHALEARLGHQVRSFAYPHGYRTEVVRRQVEGLGFDSACSSRHGLSGPWDPWFDLPRLVVTPDMDAEAFAAVVAGSGVPQVAAGDSARTHAWRYARRALKIWDRLLHGAPPPPSSAGTERGGAEAS